MSSIFSSEPVVIEDDDTDMEPVEIIDEDVLKKNNTTKELIESNTIEIDLLKEDTFSKNTSSTQGIIKNQNKVRTNNSEYFFVNALRNNTILNKIVNWCSKAPNNIGMERIIKKSLLPLYKDVHNKLKESTTLTEILKKTLRNLKQDPNHKYLYLKSLCEQLKYGHFERTEPSLTNRVQRSIRNLGMRSKKKKKKVHSENSDVPLKTYGIIFNTDNLMTEKPVNDDEVVILDRSDEEIISLDDDDTQAVCEEIDTYSNKENSLDSNDNIAIPNKEPEPPDKSLQGVNTMETDNTDLSQGVNVENQEIHLVPTNQVEYNEVDKSDIIKDLERKIARHKNIIATLEEQVVNDDNESSPYITCARLKQEVVEMYKQVCKLTNHDLILVKRREVRLKVRPGHPPGPAQRLEQFLNNSIDDRGMVAFPDFQDVVACVSDSNKIDKLNWSKQQITTEALALFKQCGQALRKQRQKREYRDLMSLVRNKLPEAVGDDPADHDPELLAKLERNRRIATAKEQQLLDRYTSLHHQTVYSDIISNGKTTPALQNPNNLQSNEESAETSMDNIKTNPTHQFVIRESPKQNDLSIQSNNETITTVVLCVSGKISILPPERETSILPAERTLILPSESSAKLHPQGNDCEHQREKTAENVTTSTEIAPVENVPTLVDVPAPVANELESTENEIAPVKIEPALIENEPAPIENEVESIENELAPVKIESALVENEPAPVENEVESIENEIAPVKIEPALVENESACRISTAFSPFSKEIGSLANITRQDSNESVNIKIENTTLDLQSRLDNLGDTYTCSIFDIEDPFLVIEISSDESSSDEL